MAKAPAGAAVVRPAVTVVPPSGSGQAPGDCRPRGAQQPKPAEQAPAAAKPLQPQGCLHRQRRLMSPHRYTTSPKPQRLALCRRTPVVEAPAQPAEIAAKAKEAPATPSAAPAEPQAPAGTGAGDGSCTCTASAPAPRRVVMPQTGPRPVYKAPIVAPQHCPSVHRHQVQAFSAASRSLIAVRRPAAPGGGISSAPLAWAAAPGQFPGGPRPKHPTRTGLAGPGGPGAPGGRPGFGAAPGFGAPRPGGFGASASGGRRRRCRLPARLRARSAHRRIAHAAADQQYPKTKEGPMKGFVPPPRFGGAHTLQQ